MSNTAVKLWALILAAIGLSICAYKSIYLGLPLQPQQDTPVWTIQAKLEFKGTGGPAKVAFRIPNIIPGFMKLDEDFISNGFGLAIESDAENRWVDWAIRRAKGQQSLFYRISLTPSDQLQNHWNTTPKFPKKPDYPEPYATAIKSILTDVRQESADVASYTRELLSQLNSKTPNENVELIRNKANSPEQWVSEIIEVLKGVRIPARTLWGVRISDAANNAQLEPLLQVHNGSSWLTYHPRTGKQGIPANFISWQVGEHPLYLLEGGDHVSINFSITKSYKELIDVARQGASQLDSIFVDTSLLSLPVQTQNVYRVLLMVPIGAMLVVFLRTFIGLNTFGTFMPVLIALAFRETQLMWGLILFTLIISLGLMIRFYLERLMLLLVPRLASILIIVVILMILISLITHKFGAERVLSVSLFPMVILAMTIERMSITWEENGAKTALLQGIGSLFVASIGYLLMTNGHLMYLMFVFPELLLILLACSLVMGRYTGYRLVELRRFKDMMDK